MRVRAARRTPFLKGKRLRVLRCLCHAMERGHVTEKMIVSAMRLFNPAGRPGDDMALKHIMLLCFAYVFELDARQEVQSVTWMTGNTLVARESEQYATIGGILWCVN